MIPKKKLKALLRQLAGGPIGEASAGISSVSLLSGGAGQVLFYAYLCQYLDENPYGKAFSRLFDENIQRLSAEPTDATLSGGFTGMLWVIQHLVGTGLLDADVLDHLHRLNHSVIETLATDAESMNFDPLHGLVGKGIYFLACPPTGEREKILTEIVSRLEGFAVRVGKNRTWVYPDPHSGTPDSERYSLGMAHGVPGVISFLAKVYQQGIALPVTSQLLEASVGWLLEQEAPVGFSLFPPFAQTGQESRVAWCYGDLGPALALFHAATALNRPDWREKAVAIALHAAGRKISNAGMVEDPVNGRVDAGFCHGAGGVAHIFHRFFQATRMPAFKHSAQYWVNWGLAGQPAAEDSRFQFPTYQETGWCWQENPSLIEGDAGLGMVLLSFLIPEPTGWDAPFMTDIS